EIFESTKGYEIIDEKEKTQLDQSKILSLKISRKKVINDYNPDDLQETRYLIQAYNIYLKRVLKSAGYVQSDPLQKDVYYHEKGGERIEAGKVYFVNGYRISLNYYDQNVLLLKSV